MTDFRPTCASCGKPFDGHLGVKGLCARVAELEAENARLRTALAEAIRRPMGVVPASAEGLLTEEKP